MQKMLLCTLHGNSCSFSWTFSDSSLGGRHSVQLIKTLSETNQGTRIESRWRRKEIDGAGVKTSLTLYSLLWQSRHFQRTHATLHPAWRGSYCPVLSGGDVLVLNCWHIADTPIWEVTGSAHAEKCYSALCMETAAVSVDLLMTQAWVRGIVSTH